MDGIKWRVRERSRSIALKALIPAHQAIMLAGGDEDDDEAFFGLYEDGVWIWDEHHQELVFDRPQNNISETVLPMTKAFGPIEFKDDMDLLEQQRFKKRYQRKTVDDDVVTLQDVKDVVLYTAPVAILTESVVNMLHIPAAERFMRCLIFYCQYFLQVSEQMSMRSLEMMVKVRTQRSIEIEKELRDNVEDLRLLVAKEYSILIAGGEGYRKFHHMGQNKRKRSLSGKDSALFETFLRITIQIIWVALGRRMLHKIEMEVHRMFKSPIFNVIEHQLQTDFSLDMSPEERFVLLGHCAKTGGKLNTRSPLMNEVSCHREMDYRLFGVGVLKYPRLNDRLLYMTHAVRSPETWFQKLKMTLGIIGLPRDQFDPMLKLISTATSSSSASFKPSRSMSRTSKAGGLRKSSMAVKGNAYPDIVLPAKPSSSEPLATEFPSRTFASRPSNDGPRRRWLARARSASRKFHTVSF